MPPSSGNGQRTNVSDSDTRHQLSSSSSPWQSTSSSSSSSSLLPSSSSSLLLLRQRRPRRRQQQGVNCKMRRQVRGSSTSSSGSCSTLSSNGDADDDDARRKRRLRIWAAFDPVVWVSGVFAVLLHVNTLDAGFVYDDSRAIENNDDINPNTPWTNLLSNDFWGTPLTHSGSHKSYRPLCVATFRLNFFLHGLNPVGYHLVNVALHGLATALFASTCRSLLFRDSVAVWTAALTFAAHPVHVEAVAGLVGRADVLACITFLLSFSAYRRHVTARTKAAFESGASNHNSSRHAAAATRQLAACVALAGVSMLCKEHGITVLAVCAGYDVFVVARMTWKDIWSLGDTKGKFKVGCTRKEQTRESVSVIAVSAVALIAARLLATGAAAPEFASADNPAAQSEALLTRTLTFAFLPVLNFLLLLWPRWLSFDWSMDTVPLVESLTDSRVAATACFYGLLVALVHKAYSSKDRGLTTALLLLIVPFIPASNLLFHVGFVVAERVLYLPSTGFCLLVGLGAGLVARRRRHFARVLVAVVLCAFAARTLVRNRDWVDEHALYTSGIPVNPAKSYGNLGRVLSAEGREKEAEAAYMSAIRLRPNMADAHYNLGVLLQNQGRNEEAMRCYKTAIRCRPKLASAYLNLGQLYANSGDADSAADVWKKCAELDSNGLRDPKAHEVAATAAVFHLGRLYADTGRYFEAIESYQNAIRRRPVNYQPQGIYNMLGEAHAKLGHYEEAERWYKAALEAKPDHVPAHLKYGRMLAKNRSRLMEAELQFLKAKELAPDDTSVYFHFGQFLLESSRYDEAAAEYETAAELAPDDVDAVLNAANALRQAGINSKAEKFYRRAVLLQPNDAASHMNLGAMLHLNGKYEEAERSYVKSLELRPNDATTLTNLERLHNLFEKRGIKRRKER